VTLKIERSESEFGSAGTFDPRIWIKSKLRLSAAGPRRYWTLKRWPLSTSTGFSSQPMRGERRRCVELSSLYQGVDVEGKNRVSREM